MATAIIFFLLSSSALYLLALQSICYQQESHYKPEKMQFIQSIKHYKYWISLQQKPLWTAPPLSDTNWSTEVWLQKEKKSQWRGSPYLMPEDFYHGKPNTASIEQTYFPPCILSCYIHNTSTTQVEVRTWFYMTQTKICWSNLWTCEQHY